MVRVWKQFENNVNCVIFELFGVAFTGLYGFEYDAKMYSKKLRITDNWFSTPQFRLTFQTFHKPCIILRQHDAESDEFVFQALEGGAVADHDRLRNIGDGDFTEKNISQISFQGTKLKSRK